MKVFNVNFGRSEKTPMIMEKRLNEILEKGALKKVTQLENPKTGRIYICLHLKEDSAPDAFAKVFRESITENMTEKMNTFLEKNEIKEFCQSISTKSNNLTSIYYIKRTAKS